MKDTFFKNNNCRVSENTITLYNLKEQNLIPEVINTLKRMHFKFKHKKIIIDLQQIKQVHAYPTVPIVGYIDYFKNILNVDVEFINIPAYLKKIHFICPDNICDNISINSTNFLDNVWCFHNSEDVNILTKGFLSSIRKGIEVEEGVLLACDWVLNEIMDNVIQHSGIATGYIMGQLLKGNKVLKVCIFDYGQGIYKSLQKSEHKPSNPTDAISLAVKEGVTRDKKIGQGNGMWGLFNVIVNNNGNLQIVSGKGGLRYINKKQTAETYDDIITLSPKQQSTTINFDIKLDNQISVKDALGGYEPIDLFIEHLEDDNDKIVYKIIDQASGTGTRESGFRIKNEIMNIYRIRKQPVVLDFEGVGIVASSFADELIGKLVKKLGIFQFQACFPMINMNNTIQTIVQRSLSQRLAEKD